MKQRLFIALISLFAILSLQAQTAALIDRVQTTLSPSEQNFNTLLRGMDSKQQQQLYSNPAFYKLINENTNLYPIGKYKSIVKAGYASGKQDGDFLPVEGNEFFDYHVMGHGEYNVASDGILFGSIQYAWGEHRNIGWNTTRYPSLYQPYLTTDSVGGDFIYEDYKLSGGYSFRLNNTYLGVYGKFHGEQAHRKTDPRALNNTTWLAFGAGAARLHQGHLYMFQAGYERNKQYVTVRYWRPGQQDRFFFTYGLGLYDVHQSKILFGFSRMHYIDQGNARFAYLSPQDKPFSLYAHVGYDYHHMKTEESDARDMYYSKTHQVEPSIRLDYRSQSSFSFSLLLEGEIDSRKGYENIFEQYLADENNYIYDFRLIDTQQNYSLFNMNGVGELKASYQIPRHRFDITGGIIFNTREEKYTSEDYRIKNTSYIPQVGLGWSTECRRSEVEIQAKYSTKLLTGDNLYEVNKSNKTIEVLDFQHAFTPYAYYNSTFSAINVDATYLYRLNKNAIGINLKLMYKTGERDPDTVYTETIGFTKPGSSAPQISATPDVHDELWGAATLFFMF